MKLALSLTLALATIGVASERAQAQWVVQPTFVQPRTVFSPVIVPGPVVQPMVVQSGPVFAPMPVRTFYRAPVVTMQPVPRVMTRYRPILGGSVSRVRYGWAPVAF
jgi:hypothetical protein